MDSSNWCPKISETFRMEIHTPFDSTIRAKPTSQFCRDFPPCVCDHVTRNTKVDFSAVLKMATSASTAVPSSLANNPSSSSPNLLYKLKITCCGRWRRVMVPANFSLYALHIVIQEIFGWESYHLHHFMSKDKEYSLGENYDEERIPEGNSHVHQRSYYASPQELLDERVYKLYNVFSEEKRVLEYEYDFGASWSHKIQFEGTVAEDPAQNGEYPLCVDGRGANRKEDCQDEDSDGELLPSFKNKKFSRQETQRNLRKVFAGKWPLKVDNTTLEKCYTCAWFKKRGGCRASSCDGKCCGVCLKSKFIRESAVQ